MKSTNPGGYLQQLKEVKSFIDFILQRIKIFNNQINTKVEFRGLLFSCRRIPNEGTTKKQKVTFADRNGLLSCYAARSNNPNIVISCSAGILWLTPRYANGKLSTSLARENYTN
jgi:hypothetical protein